METLTLIRTWSTTTQGRTKIDTLEIRRDFITCKTVKKDMKKILLLITADAITILRLILHV